MLSRSPQRRSLTAPFSASAQDGFCAKHSPLPLAPESPFASHDGTEENQNCLSPTIGWVRLSYTSRPHLEGFARTVVPLFFSFLFLFIMQRHDPVGLHSNYDTVARFEMTSQSGVHNSALATSPMIPAGWRLLCTSQLHHILTA